jgi:hypothetical protein
MKAATNGRSKSAHVKCPAESMIFVIRRVWYSDIPTICFSCLWEHRRIRFIHCLSKNLTGLAVSNYLVTKKSLLILHPFKFYSFILYEKQHKYFFNNILPFSIQLPISFYCICQVCDMEYLQGRYHHCHTKAVCHS